MSEWTEMSKNKSQYQELFMKPKESAQVAGVSTRTITRMCEDGELPAVKLRGQWRINREGFMQFIGLA